jgi:hypothetical protein
MVSDADAPPRATSFLGHGRLGRAFAIGAAASVPGFESSESPARRPESALGVSEIERPVTDQTHTGSSPQTLGSDEGAVAKETPAWSLLGFELFDLVVVLVHVVVLVLALPVELLGEHMAVRFLMGVGFFWAVRRLAKTSRYARGIEPVERQLPVHLIVGLMGWLTGAIIAAMFVLLPLKEGLNALLGERALLNDLLPLLGLVVVFFGSSIIPRSLSSASKKTDDADQALERKRQTQRHKDGPAWQVHSARMFVLLMANYMLLSLETVFQEDSNDVVMRFALACFMVPLFYLPVRLQEMFMQPEGPHRRTVMQTLLALALCKTSFGWLSWL